LRYSFSILNVFLIISVVIACNKNGSSNDDEPPLKNTNAYEQNAKLARSVNLGNALEAPAEGEWGVILEQEFFSLIKEAGFSAIRVPIRWSAHARTTAPYTINPAFLNRVNWVLSNAKQNELAAVINIHHYEEIMDNPAAHKNRFLGIWEELTKYYKNEPDDIIFEVMNEPHNKFTPEIWNEYLLEAINVIRDIDPDRTVMIGTAEWGGIGSLPKLEIPDSIPNIIVTVHYYNPFQFTHQGAEWVDGSDAWLGTQWRYTTQQIGAMKADFDIMESWSNTHDRPIFIGEFGSYNAADMISRVLWTRTFAREAEKRGMSWGYWEFCAGFGVYDNDNKTWRHELLTALIPGN